MPIRSFSGCFSCFYGFVGLLIVWFVLRINVKKLNSLNMVLEAKSHV